MQSPFETAPDAAAIPIIFATKTTWAGIAGDFPSRPGSLRRPTISPPSPANA
jgi:hypothetical protein